MITRLRFIVLAAFSVSLLVSTGAFAFQQTGGGSTAPPGGGAGGGTGGGTGGGAGGGTTPGVPTSPTQPGNTTGQQQQRFPSPQQQQQEFRRPIFLSGRLVTEEGTPPPEPATIELYCNGQSKPYGYSDSKGRFSITLGQQPAMVGADASVGSIGGFGGRNNSMDGFGPTNQGVSERDLMGCDLRAALPGYLSESISLAGRRFMDNPDMGTIFMRRLGKVEGRTVSITTANAPKEARKLYEKGLDRNRKGKFDEAQLNLAKAVELYPQYSIAWYELGRSYESMKKPEEASNAYRKSIEADGKYVEPRVALMALTVASNDWKQVLVATDDVLKLDPYSFPQAWFLNSVANLQLQKYEEAEKAAKETIKMDRDKRYPKVYHVLGVAQANRNDFASATGSLKSYLEMNPKGRDIEFVKKQLAEFEERSKSQ